MMILKIGDAALKNQQIINLDGLIGWITHMDKYVDCYNIKRSSNADKLLELYPFTQMFNMALTIRNYIEYSNLIGWTDRQLMQVIFKPDLHVKLNVK